MYLHLLPTLLMTILFFTPYKWALVLSTLLKSLLSKSITSLSQNLTLISLLSSQQHLLQHSQESSDFPCAHHIPFSKYFPNFSTALQILPPYYSSQKVRSHPYFFFCPSLAAFRLIEPSCISLPTKYILSLFPLISTATISMTDSFKAHSFCELLYKILLIGHLSPCLNPLICILKVIKTSYFPR